jgi:uncharacterized RDD family membrane protein YckC
MAGAYLGWWLAFRVIPAALHLSAVEAAGTHLLLLQGLAWLAMQPLMSFAAALSVATAFRALEIQALTTPGAFRFALSRWPRFLVLGLLCCAPYCCMLLICRPLALLVPVLLLVVAYPAVAAAGGNWLLCGLRAVALVVRFPAKFWSGIAVVALALLAPAGPFASQPSVYVAQAESDVAGLVIAGCLASPLMILWWFFGAFFWCGTVRAGLQGAALERVLAPAQPAPAQFVGARLGIRFAARLVDLLLFFSLYIPCGVVAIELIGAAGGWSVDQVYNALMPHHEILYDPLFLFFWAAYEVGWLAACGSTPGKHLLGMRVVAQDGGRLTFGRCALRWAVLALMMLAPASFDRLAAAFHAALRQSAPAWHFAPRVGLLASLIGLIGLLILVLLFLPAWERRKRGLYDLIAGSIVRRVGAEAADRSRLLQTRNPTNPYLDLSPRPGNPRTPAGAEGCARAAFTVGPGPTANQNGSPQE